MIFSRHHSRPGLDRARPFLRATRCLSFVCATALTQACKDSVSPNTTTVAGTVSLDDAWANRFDDFSGVSVSISGLSTQTVTDAMGAWRIDGVPVGKHDITYKKATFGTFQLRGQIIGDSSVTIRDVILASTPSQQAVIDSVYAAKQGTLDYYIVDGHLSAPPPANAKVGEVIALVGGFATVTTDTTTYQYWASALDITGKASKFSIALRMDGLRTTFGPGAKPYVTAYVTPPICDGCGARNPGDASVFLNTGPRANVVQLTIN
jgi:hypothetical protein